MATRVDPIHFFIAGTVGVLITWVEMHGGRIASRIVVARVRGNHATTGWIIITRVCSRNDRCTAARVVIAWIKPNNGRITCGVVITRVIFDEGRVTCWIVVARIDLHSNACTA